ncbi:MAG: hypothetical protein EA351_07575 [Gemmatimonadales bacterium]|nr:MAG: hypothetical protein EA351_07575 [Gemmatimonadales bacterium]
MSGVVALLAALLIGMIACEDVSVSEVAIHSIEITPAAFELIPQDTVRLTATPLDQAGRALPGRPIDWTALDPETATVDQSGLVHAIAPGTARIRASTGGASGLASIQVGESPQIAFSLPEVEFSLVAGAGLSSPVHVAITTEGGGALSGLAVSIEWIEGAGGWLQATLEGSSAPTTLVLRADPGTRPAGRYEASMTLSSTTPGVEPAVLTAVLEVADSAPAIGISPGALGFSSSQGQGAPNPQTVRVSNVGGGTLTGLESDIEYVAGASQGWLDASFESTTAPTDLVLRVNPTGLSPGVFDALVRVNSPFVEGSGILVQVRYRYGEPPPQFGLSPTTVTRTVEEGDPATAAVPVQITNDGSGEISGITADVEYSGANRGWVESELLDTDAPTQLLVTFDPDGLLPGSYQAQAVIQSSDAINSPASVSLHLNVLSRPLLDASTVDAAPGSITADGSSQSTVTVSLRDARGGLVARGGDDVVLTTSAGTLSSLVDRADGRYQATLTSSTTAQRATLRARLRGQSIPDAAHVQFVPGEVSPETSTITASPTRIAADGSSTASIVVELRDRFSNPLDSGGAEVVLATTAGTLSGVTDVGDGTYTASLTSSADARTATVTGTVDGSPLADQATVEFFGDNGVSAEQSTIEAAPDSMATGDASTIRVQLRDANGDPVGDGHDVFLTTDLGQLDASGGSANSDGQFTTELTSSSAGTATVTAHLGTDATGEEIGSVEVVITEDPTGTGDPDAEQSTIEADPAILVLSDTSVVTVQLRNSDGERLEQSGQVIFLTASSGSVSTNRDQTDENGQVVVTFTAGSTGTSSVTAYLGPNASFPEVGTVTITVISAESIGGTGPDGP